MEEVDVGDTVLVHNKKEKHKAREVFIVTAKNEEKIKVQKMLHPFSEESGKFMSEVYTTDQKRLKTIHRRSTIKDDDTKYEDDEVERILRQPVTLKQNNSDWNPVNQRFYNDEDSDDEDDPATFHPSSTDLEAELDDEENMDESIMIGNLVEDINTDDDEAFRATLHFFRRWAFVPVSTSQTTPIGAPFVKQFLTFPTVERMSLGMSGSGVYG